MAVKVIQKSILKQMKTFEKDTNNRLAVRTAFDNIEREVATMKRLRHPNVLRFLEVIDSVASDRLLMVLEYVSLGTLPDGASPVPLSPLLPFSRGAPVVVRGNTEPRRGHEPVP